MGIGRVNYFDWRGAWVGQVDLFLTKIGPKMLYLGLKIQFKVLGNGLLMFFKGKFRPMKQIN